DRLQVRIKHHRSDESVRDRDGKGHVGATVVADLGGLPRAVDRRHLAQGFGAGLEDEVVDRELHAIVDETAVELGAQGEQRGGINLDIEVEVRELRLRLDQATRN